MPCEDSSAVVYLPLKSESGAGGSSRYSSHGGVKLHVAYVWAAADKSGRAGPPRCDMSSQEDSIARERGLSCPRPVDNVCTVTASVCVAVPGGRVCVCAREGCDKGGM